MRLIRNSRKRMLMWIILSIVVIVAIAGIVFMNQPSFGRIPRGERLARIERSPNYQNGAFRNLHETPFMTSDKGRLRGLMDFIFKDKSGLQPDTALTVVKTDVKQIDPEEDVLVWFGHSSYLIQTDGMRFLVDPVFCMASPVSFINKPFKGTDVYQPEDMPDIDYLIISHDHWDHLDYHTVLALKNRIGNVICGLGVGEHFEYWGFEKERIIELDWEDEVRLDSLFTGTAFFRPGAYC